MKLGLACSYNVHTSEAPQPYSDVEDTSSSDSDFNYFVDSEDSEDEDIFDSADVVEVESMAVRGVHDGAVHQPISDRVNRPDTTSYGPRVLDVVSDYEDSDNLETPPTSDSDDDDDIPRGSQRFPEFNKRRDLGGEVQLEVGMQFATPDVFRMALKAYSIQVGHDYSYVKNEKSRITTICKNKYGWRIHASPSADKRSFQIKTFRRVHYYGRDIQNSRASAKWIAHEYLADFKDNPCMDLEVLGNRIRREKFIQVSYFKLFRAKQYALQLIEGEHGEQYKQLWSYAEAIITSNPGSSVNIIAPNCVFQRLYMCLAAYKNGFIKGCRPFIGINGCHLKGRYKGHLLSATGKDANGNIFLITWAVVDSECKTNRLWFLELLQEDIGPLEEKCIMSDRQKGLQQLFDTVFKDVDHRYCVRHIWMNFKGEFGGSRYLKDLLWEAARACTVTKFNITMERIKCANPLAYAWLKRIPPQRWSRHAFNTWVMCDILLNNLSESFNAYVRLARRKPIITCLETIRRLLMRRFYMKYQGIKLYEGTICPKWFNKLERYIQDGQSYIVYPHSQLQKFEVEHFSGEKSICDLELKTCFCKMWDLTGIPCKHASVAYMFKRHNPHDYVPMAYKKSTFLEAYKDGIFPVPDKSEWPIVEGRYEVGPPEHMIQPGRHKTKRRRAAGEEGPPNPTRLRRTGLVMTCRNCMGSGHNTGGCPVPLRAGIPPVRRRRRRTGANSRPEHATDEPVSDAQEAMTTRSRARFARNSSMSSSNPSMGSTTMPSANPSISSSSPPVGSTTMPSANPSISSSSPPVGSTTMPSANPSISSSSPRVGSSTMPSSSPSMASSTPSIGSTTMPSPPPARTPLVIPSVVTPARNLAETTTQRLRNQRIFRPRGVSGSFNPPRPISTPRNSLSRNHIQTRRWIP